MNRLSKSTIALIVLVAAAVILGVVLFLTVPDSLTDGFKAGGFLERGHHQFTEEGVSNFRHPGMYKRGFNRFHGFPFGIIIFIGLILIFAGRRHSWRHKDHSRAILDRMYAEEKISKEEYLRKRTVIEEE